MNLTDSRAGGRWPGAAVALLWLVILGGASAAPAPKTAGAAAPASASPSPSATPAVPLTDIAAQSQATITRLNDVVSESPAEQSVGTAREALPALSAQVNQWLTDSSRTVNERPSLDALGDLQSRGHKLATDLGAQSAVLNERAKTLGDEDKQIGADLALWTQTEKDARAADAPADTLELCQGVLTAARNAAAKLKERRTTILDLQSQVGVLNGKLNAGLETVEQANAAALKTLFVRDSPPLWSTQTEPNAGPGDAGVEPPSQQAAAALTYAREHLDLILAHVAIFCALLGLLFWLRRGLHQWTEEDPQISRSAPIFDVPIATAFALSFLVKGNIYAGAPPTFRALLGALLLLPMIVLLRRLTDPRLHSALYFLILFYLVSEVRTTLNTLLLLNRWIFSAEMVAATLVFWWVTKTGRSGQAEAGAGAVLGRLPMFLCRMAILLLLGALAVDALGYARLGTMVGTGVLRSCYTAAVFYTLLQVLAGLLLIVLRARPLSISHVARQHHSTVQRRVYRGLRVLAILAWLWLTLGFFEVQPLAHDWIARALDYDLPTGSLKVSVGQLLGFAAAIWVSVQAARVIRFFLEEEVFQHVHLSPGLPYAISTMVNYLVLCIGILVGLGTLHVGFDKITILVSAFSVGLGFGLQNIINNFVSGVILLFERPVKVGDIIQIGDAIGEVRRIGIRASVISTRDGSDVIVPNGNLISNQFTNWTYSDRARYVEIPVSIASGPDPNHVLALLKTAAAGHNATKNQAAPEAYITALTASGISFVVRAWISHYEDWVQARSELSLALVDALAREEIKLA